MPKGKNGETNDETQKRAELAGRLLEQAAGLTEMAGKILTDSEPGKVEEGAEELSEAELEKLADEGERESGRASTLGRRRIR